MNVTKSITTAGVGAAIIAGSMLAVTAANAQGPNNNPEIVDRLATELNVNKDDVQAVFDSVREEKMAEREAKQSEHVASLVAEGKLTQEQADSLKAKHEEMQAAREALKNEDLTQDEMMTKMEELRSGFEKWAEDQDIDLEALRPEHSGRDEGMHMGGHMGFMHHNGNDMED